jgi:hypothetical protein
MFIFPCLTQTVLKGLEVNEIRNIDSDGMQIIYLLRNT